MGKGKYGCKETYEPQDIYRSASPDDIPGKVGEGLRIVGLLAQSLSTRVAQTISRASRKGTDEDLPRAFGQMSQQGLLKLVVEVLNRLGIDYMVSGSVVSSLQGEPRATHDIDVVWPSTGHM